MGRRNHLGEGVSATGKTSVCEELQRRGYRVVHGDRELAHQGDATTGAPVEGHGHEHLWDVAALRALVADRREGDTFFCGGCRNVADLLELFDGVVVLEVDRDTLRQRLDQRPAGEWGADPSERELVLRLHQSGEDTPDGTVIDAAAPLPLAVDELLSRR